VGGGHASGQTGWIHVGLGDAREVQAAIQWPDGTWSDPYTLSADQFVILDRAKQAAEPWQPITGN
jgi:hypothetical protein